MDVPLPNFTQTLGPLGLDIPPAGETPFEDLEAQYRRRLAEGEGPVHINCMMTMAECRAAILAARARNCFPAWVSWQCGEDGESPTGVHMLAALFVAEGMGAAAFGLDCPEELALAHLKKISRYASIPLFYLKDGEAVLYPYAVTEKDPDVIPCATGTAPSFVTRTVDVGEGVECGPNLLEDIIAAEDDPVGAM